MRESLETVCWSNIFYQKYALLNIKLTVPKQCIDLIKSRSRLTFCPERSAKICHAISHKFNSLHVIAAGQLLLMYGFIHSFIHS